MNTLFDVDPAAIADTNDDWYTPPWLFKAAGIMFDMDVAAPVDPGRRTCPAREYLTPVEDGLTHSWHGIVWCNPPYSRPAPWVERFAAHSDGLLLVPAASSAWLGTVLAAADALTMIRCNFLRPDGGSQNGAGRAALVLSARGLVCVDGLQRVAAADHHARGAYLVRT